MAEGASPDAVDEAMTDADVAAEPAGTPPPDGPAAVAAGQAAGNIHLSTGDAETLEHAAASRAAADRQARLIAEVEERRRLRATVVPTDVGEVKMLLRQLEQPITMFGEREMERRERLRKLLADLDEERVLEAMDALEPQDQQQQQFVPSTTFYTEGGQALLEARLALARFSLARAAERTAAAKRQRADPDADAEAEEAAVEEGVRAVVMQSSEIGDERPVVVCAFSPDGATLASAAWSGRLRLWRSHRCEKQLSVQAHDTRITGLAWHPHAQPGSGREGVSLATGAADTTARLWSETGQLLQMLSGHTDRLGRIAFHPMGQHLGTASYDLTWRLWDVKTGDCLLEQEGHSRAVYTVGFHPDGSLAASGGSDAIGRVWDLRTGRSIMLLEGHVKAILAVDFAPNGYQCATGSEDHSVRVWDLRKRGALYMIPAHQSLVSQVRYEPLDGGYLMTTGYDNICRMWSSTTFKRLATLTGHESRIMCGDIAPDGSHTVVSVGYDKTIKLWAPDEPVAEDPSEPVPM